MKQLLLTYGFILLMILTGGCSKDDEPGSGNAKANGEYVIDGQKFDLKYAYVYVEDDCYEYSFYDTDVLKYVEKGQDIDEVDKEISSLYISYNTDIMEVDEVIIDHKMNGYRGTGVSYSYYNRSGCGEYVSFTSKGNKVKAYSESIPLDGYNYGTGRYTGECIGAFSVEGNPKNVTYLDDLEEYENFSRGMEVVEVSDPKQISFLKSLHTRNRFPSNKD